MKINALFLLLAALAGAAPNTLAKTKAQLNEEFRIKVGQQVTIKKLSIKFSAVNSESRCPTGVQCIWAGNAAIAVEIAKKNKKPVPATLNTNTGVQPNELDYKGYKIKLVGLNPYPKINETIDEKDYEVTLIVTRE
jgi:hypothetical protein